MQFYYVLLACLEECGGCRPQTPRVRGLRPQMAGGKSPTPSVGRGTVPAEQVKPLPELAETELLKGPDPEYTSRSRVFSWPFGSSPGR